MIDQSVFDFLRKDKTCSFQLLKMRPEVKATEEKYKKYRVSREPELKFANNSYYVARNWGKESTERFVNKIQ